MQKKTTEEMLQAALNIAEEPDAVVAFFCGDRVESQENWRLCVSLADESICTVVHKGRVLRFKSGGKLAIRWTTTEDIFKNSGLQVTHLFCTSSVHGKCSSFLESKIRSTKPQSTRMGLYLPEYKKYTMYENY